MLTPFDVFLTFETVLLNQDLLNAQKWLTRFTINVVKYWDLYRYHGRMTQCCLILKAPLSVRHIQNTVNSLEQHPVHVIKEHPLYIVCLYFTQLPIYLFILCSL